ncbi:hypothetical protein SAMN05444722_3227 [Rhodovulum sp. ES.010]|uniref:hypothetical protein n=1 Tax=Rhodovulum sp. ES.010 TaxID=1882821 RepID=UPI00092B27B2|nr:hypothetical protein [Rhodovulum sp. ES.010]SIO53511.1 hypothetical protein SAMN05444722_3227 [Rhodovulum sp. ES.010]
MVGATLERFPPMLLTTLTTFFRVFRLILERSVQAGLLVPKTISPTFGSLAGLLILQLPMPAHAEPADRARDLG